MGSVGCETNWENEMACEEFVMYRGFRIAKNYTSIHGTGARLAKFRGYNIRVGFGVGAKSWYPNLEAARKFVDYLYENFETLPPATQAAVRYIQQQGA
jgi:hypothetical protein